MQLKEQALLSKSFLLIHMALELLHDNGELAVLRGCCMAGSHTSHIGLSKLAARDYQRDLDAVAV
jgi:hypothetical protein